MNNNSTDPNSTYVHPKIISPTHFDDLGDATNPQSMQAPQMQPTMGPMQQPIAPVIPQLTPEQQAAAAEKSSRSSLALSIVMGLIAVAGVSFGIWGIISSVTATSQFDDLEADINSLESKIDSLTSTVNTMNINNAGKNSSN